MILWLIMVDPSTVDHGLLLWVTRRGRPCEGEQCFRWIFAEFCWFETSQVPSKIEEVSKSAGPPPIPMVWTVLKHLHAA